MSTAFIVVNKYLCNHHHKKCGVVAMVPNLFIFIYSSLNLIKPDTTNLFPELMGIASCTNCPLNTKASPCSMYNVLLMAWKYVPPATKSFGLFTSKMKEISELSL